MSTAEQLATVYDGGNVTLRVLRALGWGPQLLNLGYFVWRGPLNALNLLPSRVRLLDTQMRLVRKAAAHLGLQVTSRGVRRGPGLVGRRPCSGGPTSSSGAGGSSGPGRRNR